ncbi:IMP dehydrogenase [Propionibacterium sp. oral taxon 192 str. F0372]|uniref:GuaB3 family IMP dehydrogenase-related protein n=1 Tax=Propionibacterium sp. oral taxon 192 TaxID=671222 RepID=UPI0003547946|nr:GuaB3 family IMP dehydrogenase-related protein [Propionibacterium sp. oral taxon 192]EPH02357.1 IMP dehydrogenase [Propionibacterium sp. oral taxon 192 str. F0372]
MDDIGRSKRAERAFSLDDVAIMPTRRTRAMETVDLEWKCDAITFSFPLLAAPMDSVMSPRTAIEFGRLGGLGVLNLEGLWTRYEDPLPVLEELAGMGADAGVTARLQEIYAAPIRAELITERLRQIREADVPVAGALSPQNAQEFAEVIEGVGCDFFVIRGTAVSAQHVARDHEPLDLAKFIHEMEVPVIVGGCATYQTALHLMRTGAAGVLVGFGGAAMSTNAQTLGIEVPMATAISDAAEARRDYLDESGGRYVHVIADGSMGYCGDVVKALACGADAAMLGTPLARATDAPGKGWHWGPEAWHQSLPRGRRVHMEQVGSLAEIIAGPSHSPDGEMNFAGALRRALATTGYTDVKSFQRIDLIIR